MRLLRVAPGLALALGLSSATLRAQQPDDTPPPGGLTVRAVESLEVRSEPGSVLTALLQLRNGASDTLRLRARVTAPPEWSVVTGTRTFALAPGAATVWIATIALPAAAPAGRHAALLELVDGEGATRFRDSLRVTVTEHPRVQIRLLATSEYVLSGDSLVVGYLVRNLGNAPGRFRIDWSSLGALRALTAQGVHSLGAGESATGSLTLAAPRDLQRSRAERVEVRAVGAAGAAASDTASLDVLVVPRPGSVRALSDGLPAQIRLVGAQGGIFPSHAELTASGRLGEHGPQIDLVGRSVDPTAVASPIRDEYGLRVRGATYSVQAGDGYFERSPLLGFGRAASGVGGTVVLGGVEVGGAALRDRFGAGGSEELARAGIRLPSDGSIGALYRHGDGPGAGDLASAIAELAAPGAARLSLEYGAGRGPAGWGRGLSAELRASTPRLSYDFAHQRATAALPGPLAGSTSSTGSLALRPGRGLEMSAYATRNEREPLGPDAAYGTRLDRIVGVRAGLSGLLDVDFTRARRAGRAGGNTFDQRDRSVRLQTFQQLGPASLQGSATFGALRRDGAASDQRWTDLMLSSYLTGGGGSIQSFIEYQRGSQAGAPDGEVGWSGGLTATQRFAGRTLAALTLERRVSIVHLEAADRLEARIEQRLGGGESVALELLLSRGAPGVQPPSGLRLEYAMPLHLPVARRQRPGTVVGRVVDAASGQGVAGALVRVADQVAISDGDGTVRMGGLEGGRYRLSLAPVDRNAGLAVQGDSMVVVGDGSRRRAPFRIALTRGGRVRGTVQRFAGADRPASAGDDSLVAVGGVENAWVVLVSAGDTIRRLTDRDGGFDAGNLRPGHWTARLEPGGLGPREAAERETVAFDLLPGATETLLLAVRPRAREFRLVTTGEVAVATAPPRPAAPARGARPARVARSPHASPRARRVAMERRPEVRRRVALRSSAPARRTVRIGTCPATPLQTTGRPGRVASLGARAYRLWDRLLEIVLDLAMRRSPHPAPPPIAIAPRPGKL
jgi:hypothetical protein